MFKRYELHNHTNHSDAKITCREFFDMMISDGVDCFAITDHNTTSSQIVLRQYMEEEKPHAQCMYGMEYTTYYGHIVCPVLETYVPWDSIDRHKPELLFEACKKAGAITGIAHPFAYYAPFAQGCRFEMDIHDFSNVDYIEIVNNAEPILEVNSPAIQWWEELNLNGTPIAACAGMDLHYKKTLLAMKFGTYAEGVEGGDALAELRTALATRMTWLSKGMLVKWEIEGDSITFTLHDVHKPGFIYSDRYILTLKNKEGVREFDITDGTLTLPLADLAEVEIPKLYSNDTELENLICVAPIIRK